MKLRLTLQLVVILVVLAAAYGLTAMMNGVDNNALERDVQGNSFAEMTLTEKKHYVESVKSHLHWGMHVEEVKALFGPPDKMDRMIGDLLFIYKQDQAKEPEEKDRFNAGQGYTGSPFHMPLKHGEFMRVHLYKDRVIGLLVEKQFLIDHQWPAEYKDEIVNGVYSEVE